MTSIELGNLHNNIESWGEDDVKTFFTLNGSKYGISEKDTKTLLDEGVTGCALRDLTVEALASYGVRKGQFPSIMTLIESLRSYKGLPEPSK